MEDIIIVIWVAMIILGSVINSVNKRRQKQIEPEGEADEARDLPQRPVIIRVPAPVSSKEARSIESESLESLEPETRWPPTHTPRQAKEQIRARQAKNPAKHTPKQTAHPAKTHAKPQPTLRTKPSEIAKGGEKGAERGEMARTFDLEQAVIYSEILKPKYQEYE